MEKVSTTRIREKMCVFFYSFIILCFIAASKDAFSVKQSAILHDFGEVKEGDTPKHTFFFTNTTNQNIKILKMRVPCGCAETKVDKKLLAPGEKSKFSIKLDSKGRRGKIKKSLYLLTDSKKTPIVYMHKCMISVP